MKTVLITGGCGFIGSHFIRRFHNTHPDWKIINLDKLTYAGNRANLQDLETSGRYHFFQGDICHPPTVDGLMKAADAVIHFAAETHVDRSIDNASDFLTTNVQGTRVLLDAAKERGVERFLHISTDEVYGSIEKGSFHEDSPLLPSSPYSASKAAADLLVRSYGVTFGLPGIIVRSTNNFGPYQFPEKIIPLFITNLLENKKVPLYGRGINSRDWIYVEDNCRAVELVFDRGRPREIYNIGAGNEMTNLELTRRILAFFGKGEEMIEYVSDRPGHDLRYSVETTKIRTLGFTPQVRFDEALEQTLRWYRDHREWWQRLKKDKYTLK